MLHIRYSIFYTVFAYKTCTFTIYYFTTHSEYSCILLYYVVYNWLLNADHAKQKSGKGKFIHSIHILEWMCFPCIFSQYHWQTIPSSALLPHLPHLAMHCALIWEYKWLSIGPICLWSEMLCGYNRFCLQYAQSKYFFWQTIPYSLLFSQMFATQKSN